jgi:hypothetical protein
MESEQKFWIIWNPQNRNPINTILMHPYLHEAKAEAERLASCNPGQSFYVLQSVGKATTTMVTYVEIEKGGCNG